MARKTSLARSAAGLPRYYMDSGWWRHPRNISLDLAAIGLYSCIVGACNEHATNGDLPARAKDVAKMLGLDACAVRRPLRALIDAGCLTVESDGRLHVVDYKRTYLAAPGTRRAKIPRRIRELVYRRDGHRCRRCGSQQDLSLDHIEPWSFGGSDDLENLQTLCRSCNSRKGARREVAI